MEKFIVISSKSSENEFSAYLFNKFSKLDIATWLGSLKVKSETPEIGDRALTELIIENTIALNTRRALYVSLCRVPGIVTGVDENIAKIRRLDGEERTCSECISKLLRHFTRQISAVWTNMSLLFQFNGIVVTEEDVEKFTLCALLWSLASSCESMFKFVLVDAFAAWTRNKVWAGEELKDGKYRDVLIDERPPVPRGMQKNALFFMFSKRMGYNLKTTSFPQLRDNDTRWKFWFSVLQAKKGTYPIPEWDIDAELTGTFATLTSSEEIDPLLDPILVHSIYKTVKEVLRPASRTHRPLLPSPSAAEGYTRTKGGGLQAVSEHLWSRDGKIEYPTNFDQYDSADEQTRFSYTDLPQDLLRNLWCDRTLNPEVTAHKVLESFKLRVITTGPAVDYYLAKYINRIVHGQIMKHPTFEFTAGPVTVEKLQEIYLMFDEILESVDYKAATDNMKARYTRVCWHAICCVMGWSWDVYEWGCQSLTRSILKFKLNNGTELVGLQERGQLMGNFLSFPILCLCNAAALRIVEQTSRDGCLPQRRRGYMRIGRVRLDIQRYHLKKLRHLRVKVNGDDGLVVIKPRNRNILAWVTGAMGYTLSVGKSYSSRDFGMINSKLFVLETDLTGLRIPSAMLPYVNLGLIKGTGRVLSDTRRDDLKSQLEFYSDCGTKARKLTEGFNHADQKVLMSMFIGWNRAALQATSRDWYLPRNLGGLEMPWTGDGDAPPLSKHAAIVASYAQSVGGICIDPAHVANLSSLRYRRTVPHVLVDRAELPEDYDSCDDTVKFWTAGTLERTDAATCEGRFFAMYRKALREKVAPMKERVQRRWVSVPAVSFVVPALPLPFFDGDTLT